MEYLKDLNGNQAAIRAGHSMRSTYATAERMLRNAEISREISEANQKVLRNAEVSVESNNR
jgi:phage terminase small subunit